MSRLQSSEKEVKLALQSVISLAMGELLAPKTYTLLEAQQLYLNAKKTLPAQIFKDLLLKSVVIDLTSAVKQLSINC
jgi:hypothetical protein